MDEDIEPKTSYGRNYAITCYKCYMKEILSRRLQSRVQSNLSSFPAVLLIGARNVGKTTLAQQIALGKSSAVYDLERLSDRSALEDPAGELLRLAGKLIIIDEVQRVPEPLSDLRPVIDKMMHMDAGRTELLLTCSVAHELKRQTESLASRYALLHLHGIDLLETAQCSEMGKLWERGGFPQSYFAESIEASIQWRDEYINKRIAQELAYLNMRVSSDSLEGLLRLLAAMQGDMANKASLARALKVSPQTVKRHIRILEAMMLISRLPPYIANSQDRIVKSPKYYVCDSGLLNSFSSIGNSKTGGSRTEGLRDASWEGFAIENMRSVLPKGWRLCYFRTHEGAQMDLVIEKEDNKIWAVAIKFSTYQLSERNRKAQEMLRPERTFVVHGYDAAFGSAGNVEVLPLAEMMKILLSHNETTA